MERVVQWLYPRCRGNTVAVLHSSHMPKVRVCWVVGLCLGIFTLSSAHTADRVR